MAKTDQKARRGSIEHDTRVIRNNLDISTLSFNWNTGTFEQPLGSWPLGLKLLVHLTTAAAIVVTCVVIIVNDLVAGSSNLIAENPDHSRILVEIIRWSIFLGLGYMGYVLANCATSFTVKLAGVAYKVRSREAPVGIRRFFDAIVWLNPYICRFIGGTTLLFAAFWLFPLSVEEQKQIIFDPNLLRPTPTTKEEAANDITRLFTEPNLIGRHSFHFLVSRAVMALLVFLGIILLEKIILRNIAMTFYLRSYGKRVDNNTFVLKTSKTLRRMVLASREDLCDKSTAIIIFEGVCPQNRQYITSSDIATLIRGIDADRYFQLVDAEGDGKMSLEFFTHALDLQVQENEILRTGLQQQAGIINKLDSLFSFFCYFVIAIAAIILFQVSIQDILAPLAGIMAIVLFLSTGTLKTAVESILFVIFTHPFDVGDHVIIKGEAYVVKELGLWTTTFESSNGNLTYIANSRLRTELIINNRRSPFQNELITFNVLPAVPLEKLQALEARMLDFVRDHPKDYVPKLSLSGYAIVDNGTMKMQFQLFHRGNFQDAALKDQRTKKFYLALKEAINSCDVILSNPPAMLAH